MDRLSWNTRFNIGVEEVDTAHARLFRIAGKLMDLAENQASRQNAVRESIRYLEDYTMTHFSQEEAYMRSVRYKGYDRHKKLHDDFRDKTLVSLKRQLEKSDYSPAVVQRFLGVLVGWLTGHIMTEDQAITGNMASGRVYEAAQGTPEVAEAIIQAMDQVFRLKTELLDGNYNGRSMGKGFCYRLCYDMDNGGKAQVLLGAEKRLARRGAGLILGLPALQNEELVKDASMQVLQQFLHHTGGLFQSEGGYKLSKAELLTDDEFREDFMTRYPCSLLFETRLGHFIFCARTWEPKRRKSSNQEPGDS